MVSHNPTGLLVFREFTPDLFQGLTNLQSSRFKSDTWPSLCLLVHCVLCLQVYQSDQDLPAETLSVNLSSQELKRLVGSRSSQLLRALVEVGVLEKTKGYSVGHFAASYRPTQTFRSQPLRWVNGPGFHKKLRKLEAAAERKPECLGNNQGRRFVYDSMFEVSCPEGAETPLLESSDLSYVQKARIALGAADIRSQSFWFKTEGGRVWNTINNCPKELRKHLWIGGEPAAEVDMHAAQFFLLLPEYDEAKGEDVTVERDAFSMAVTKGDFYRTLYQYAYTERGVFSGVQRDRFKKACFKDILCADTSSQFTGRPREAFKECFPWMEGHLHRLQYGEGANSAFALHLQQRESDLIHDRVIPRIMRELPGVPVVSIHDALMCSMSKAEEVSEILLDEAKAFVGMKPIVRL